MKCNLDDILLHTKFKKDVAPMHWQSARTIACRVYLDSTSIMYAAMRREDIRATNEEIVKLIGEAPGGAIVDYIGDRGLMDI